MATIFAWSGALGKRGEMDGNDALCYFSKKLEKATIDTIEGGVMTGDLAVMTGGQYKGVDTAAFLRAVRANLEKALA